VLSPDEIAIVELSCRVAGTATLAMLPVGIGLAWLLSRPRLRGKVFLDALVSLPLVVPPVVTGYLLLVTLGHNGLIGRWLETRLGIVVAFDWKGAAIASAVMALPLLVRAVRLSMEGTDPGLVQAARTLGAGPVRAFVTVTLPLAAPGIVAGSVLAFARSLGEFGATITFVGNIAGRTRTLPLAIYRDLQTPGGETDAVRLVVLSLLLAFAALAASELLARRLMGGRESDDAHTRR